MKNVCIMMQFFFALPRVLILTLTKQHACTTEKRLTPPECVFLFQLISFTLKFRAVLKEISSNFSAIEFA